MTLAKELDEMGRAMGVLKDVWGYDSFRPLQENSVQCVLNCRDSLTVLPTGGGKSLCFQIPALCRDGMAVVVSPLISLMKDQVDALVACGVSAAFVNSTQSPDEKRIVADQIRQGKLKLLYVAPERLLAERTLEFLRQSRVSFFAIDEAHCISNWGHDFRPEYRGLRVLKKCFPGVSVHAFTATASEPVRDDIVSQLGLHSPEILVGNFDRPNLVYRMLRASGRLQQVAEVIERHRGESGIVYCISRNEVDRTAGALNAMGCRALPYHAGMADSQRKANQDAFIKEQCDIIVATVAFGMGIDKSNVRFVVHAGMPKSIEHYQQESGRAGRDGLDAECVLIYSAGDVVTWKKIMEGDSPDTVASASRSLDAMSDLCSGVVCRHKKLVEHFGQEYATDNCNACDVCLDEVALVDDPITLSQKILSCVLRQEQRFGAAHTAKVLTGSSEARIRELGHDQLSTYGLLARDGMQAVRMWIEQLVAQGFLARTGEYQTLSLTPSGRRLLKRDGNPRLSRPTVEKATRISVASDDSWDGVDRDLFEQLRALRGQMAKERNVPAYIVFGDATLRDLARYRPSTLEAFGQVRGVGAKKLQDFGEEFKTAIVTHCQQHSLPMDIATTTGSRAEPGIPVQTKTRTNSFMAFDAFRRGDSIASVAEQLGRATSTVAGYLVDFLNQEQVTDPTPWVDQATVDRVCQELHRVEDGRLKPLYESLHGEVDYDSLRIIVACVNNQLQKSTE